MFGFLKRKGPPPSGPYFSDVDSREKAEARFAAGQLDKVYLLPLEFGGQEEPGNVLYVPIGFHDIKVGIDMNIVAPLVEDEKVSHYQCQAEYEGKSVIPIALKITASDPGQFTTTINIWGSALGRE